MEGPARPSPACDPTQASRNAVGTMARARSQLATAWRPANPVLVVSLPVPTSQRSWGLLVGPGSLPGLAAPQLESGFLLWGEEAPSLAAFALSLPRTLSLPRWPGMTEYGERPPDVMALRPPGGKEPRPFDRSVGGDLAPHSVHHRYASVVHVCRLSDRLQEGRGVCVALRYAVLLPCISSPSESPVTADSAAPMRRFSVS